MEITNKFDGNYSVNITIYGESEILIEKLTINTEKKGKKHIIKDTSRLSFLDYDFVISGEIDDITGLATIEAKSINSGVKLDPAMWTFVSNQALKIISAPYIVFNGGAAIGFGFSLSAQATDKKETKKQSLPPEVAERL